MFFECKEVEVDTTDDFRRKYVQCEDDLLLYQS